MTDILKPKQGMLSSRKQFLKDFIGPGKVIAEVGVFRGVHAASMMGTNPNSLFLIDRWRAFREEEVGGEKQVQKVSTKGMLNAMCEAIMACKPNQNIAKIIRMDSLEAAELFPDYFFDFVYIDGGHKYEFVKTDLEAWYPKVKRGGWFGGHDLCSQLEGVMRAVSEFLQQTGLHLDYTTADKFPSFYLRKPA